MLGELGSLISVNCTYMGGYHQAVDTVWGHVQLLRFPMFAVNASDQYLITNISPKIKSEIQQSKDFLLGAQ